MMQKLSQNKAQLSQNWLLTGTAKWWGVYRKAPKPQLANELVRGVYVHPLTTPGHPTAAGNICCVISPMICNIPFRCHCHRTVPQINLHCLHWLGE